MKKVLIITEDQYHLLINALNDLRTKCIAENIDTKDINELLLLIIDSPVKGFVRIVILSNQDKKYNYLLYFIGVIPVIWLALLIAPITEGGLVSIFNNFGNVFNNPFNILWSENSIKTILIFLLIYIFVIIFYESSKKNYRRKEEHGSARWGEARTLNKKYKQFPENMNKTLTKNVELGLNGRKHKRNVNVLVVGRFWSR